MADNNGSYIGNDGQLLVCLPATDLLRTNNNQPAMGVAMRCGQVMSRAGIGKEAMVTATRKKHCCYPSGRDWVLALARGGGGDCTL
jgi:hypothetical protein